MSGDPRVSDPQAQSDDDIEDDLYGQESPASVPDIRAPDWVVSVVRGDRSIFQLHRQWKQGGLDLQSDFQRGFIWKTCQQVRLVESVLARIPLPAIYLWEEETEDRVLVIDGLQRLTSLFRFLDNEFPLKGLQLLGQFEGRHFRDLETRYRRRIEDTNLTVFSIQPGADPMLKFFLFERLNQGGVALNAQEIRNGIYRGTALEMIQRLAAPGGPFRALAGERRRWSRMKADELVLRAFAFQELALDSYPGDMEPFLNEALNAMNRLGSDKLLETERRFLHALGKVRVVFGHDAFKRFDVERGVWGSHLNAAVMDLQLWGFRQVPCSEEFWAARREAVVSALISLHERPEFRDSIIYATSISARVKYRLDTWKEALEDAARNHA